jgi:hypothetical protein
MLLVLCFGSGVDALSDTMKDEQIDYREMVQHVQVNPQEKPSVAGITGKYLMAIGAAGTIGFLQKGRAPTIYRFHSEQEIAVDPEVVVQGKRVIESLRNNESGLLRLLSRIANEPDYHGTIPEDATFHLEDAAIVTSVSGLTYSKDNADSIKAYWGWLIRGKLEEAAKTSPADLAGGVSEAVHKDVSQRRAKLVEPAQFRPIPQTDQGPGNFKT